MLVRMTLLAPDDARPAPDLRARKREATHEALATAAFALAREHGLDGFTVDDVARRADVSRRTFFNYFTSKEQAVTAVVQLQIASLLDQVERTIAEEGTAVHAEAGGPDLLDTAVRSLLSPASVETFRALIALAEDNPELLPHLAGLEHSAGDHVVELMRGKAAAHAGVELHPVHAYAIPGAIIATVGAVYSRRLHVREVDGDAPGALGLDDVVDQLRALLPDLPECRV
jgi:AcrR family transcriptional regulator